MATALNILENSSELAGEKAFNAGLNPIKEANYLGLLNSMLAAWRNEGVDLQLATLLSSDTVYIDDADQLAIEYALAVLIMEREGSPLKPTVIARAGDLERSLRSKYETINEMDIPKALQPRHYAYYDINQE